MPDVFIGAGSNADPERSLQLAVAELARRFGPMRCSSVYRGAAFGAPAADYLNLVVTFETASAVDAINTELRAIEALAGRTRTDAAVCELDLDVLSYGRRVDAARRLPRPGLFRLPFVLVPLAELAPDFRHPITGERCGLARSAMANALTNFGGLPGRA
jgi:2-amino-4-hydroxy-6-hydroxymethyldihydropteridine diphosphokinase